MTTTLLQKTVLPGFNEYHATIPVNSFADTLSMEFDDDFIVDQISVESINGWHVILEYPASRISSPSIMFQSGNASLNPYPSREGRMWYRIPAHTKVTLAITSAPPTAENLKITVLGRG